MNFKKQKNVTIKVQYYEESSGGKILCRPHADTVITGETREMQDYGMPAKIPIVYSL